MAFEIVAPKRTLLLEDEHQPLFELPERLGLEAPRLAQLWERFYGDTQLDAAAVAALRAELAQILERYAAVLDERLRAEGLDAAAARKRRNADALVTFLRDFVSVCAEATAANNAGLSFRGD
jgi:hypothetical protein